MDKINPKHYQQYSMQCIDITEQLPFCLGNCIKYIWRAGDKDEASTDYEKALWYLNRAENNREFTFKVTLDLHKIASEMTGIKQDMFIALYTNNYAWLRQLLNQAI